MSAVFFTPRRLRKEAPPLEDRLVQMENALVRAGDLARVLVDPSTGLPVAVGAQGAIRGGGGGSTAADTLTHDLLGDHHASTVRADPLRGALITGQGTTPLWTLLQLGALNRYLASDGTDAVWQQIQHSHLAFSGLTAGQYWRASSGTAAAFSSLLFSDLVYSGLTSGQYLRASGATAAAFSALQFADLTYSGLTSGRFLKSTGATAASFSTIGPSDLTFSGLTTGQYWRATGATAAAFGALLFSDLTYSSLTAGHLLVASGATAAGFEAPGTRIIRAGLTAARPAASSVPDGTLYLATDDDGGTLFRGNGSSWVQCGMGATETASTSTTHNLLSSTHPDTTAAAVVRGDLITGQGATPTWQRLALGLSGRVLKSDGSDASWGQVAHSELTGVGPNDHHNQAHTFFGSDHSDVTGTPAAGDLIYRNGSGQWTRLAKGTDGQVLKLVSGVPVWANVNSLATARAPMYGWRRSNINTGASTSFTEMPGFDGVNTGERMAYSGTIVGISVVLDGDVGAAGDSYAVECYRATSDSGAYAATGVTCTITGSTGTERSNSGSGFSVAFNAGDILTVYDKKTGSVNGRAAKCHLLVVFD